MKRRNFLKKTFLGIYYFERELLKNSVVIDDLTRYMDLFVKTQTNYQKRGEFLNAIGLDELPRFMLFKRKEQFPQIETLFEGLNELIDRLNRRYNLPRIMLCLDNLKEPNAMCIGAHPQFGLQRIRHTMVRTAPITKDFEKQYPFLLKG